MDTLNKKALADTLADKLGVTKKAALEAVDTVFEEITSALANGTKVDLSGFGKFEIRERAERTGINPMTKESIKIKASKVPAFKAAKALKEKVN